MVTRSRCRWWQPCLSVVGAVAAAMAGAGSAFGQSDPQFEPFKKPVTKALGISNCTLVQLNVINEPERPQVIQIPIEGFLWTFNLMPHSVRGPNFQLLEQRADGQIYSVKPPKETTLRGWIAGQPDSVVAGGLMPDGLCATAIFSDGSRYWIEPVSKLAPGAPEGLYAIYNSNDVVAGPWRCGNVDPVNPPPTDGQPPIGNRGATLFTAQLSTDADFEFFSRYGGTGIVNTRISLVVNIMNVQYERETDITHVLATQLVRTAEQDPYASTDSNNLLDSFRNDWNVSRPGSRGDINQLFTGKEVDGNTIGLAFVGVVCSTNAYGIVQSDFNGNLMSATDLSAHEAGHNWSATHCTCSGSGNTPSTMNPFITSINRFTFSNDVNNIGQIVGHRNSRGCLTSGGGGTDPRNDLCASATPIGPGLIGWNNTGAANDGPAACGLFGTDIWYSYVAPCDGNITVNTCGSNHDTTLAIYTGSCGALTELGCNDDFAACGGTGRQSQVSVNVTRGTLYRIRLGGFNSAVGDGLLSLAQSACPSPSNDTCAGAVTIDQGSHAFSTIGADSEGPLELTLCNASGDAQVRSDIWYRYVAPCAGTVRVSTCSANFDSKLAIYTSCPGGINTAIACNDDNGPDCSGTRSSVEFASTRGTAYLIRLGGYNAAVGTGNLVVSSLSCPPPANDDCAAAVNVAPGDYTGNNAGASTDGAANCGGTGSRDVWYSFTAPANGQLRVTTCGTHDAAGLNTGMDTVLSIHPTCPGTAVNTLVCNDDYNTSGSFPGACTASDTGVLRDSAVATGLTAGQSVLIRVAAFSSGFGGDFMLHVSWVQSNDTCATAQLVGTSAFSVNNDFANNELDPLDGACNASAANGIDNSVWYAFVPSGTGNATGTIDPTTYDGVAVFYSSVAGSCGALAEIGCVDEPEPMNFSVPVTAGQTYYLAIGDWGVADGGGVTNVTLVLPVAGGTGACCCGSTCLITSSGACTGTFQGASTVCNAPGNNTSPCCRGDFNRSGGISVQDIFDFLAAYFANNPCADANQSSTVSVQDIFDFLAAYFAGGC